jgi:hypothetical protein
MTTPFASPNELFGAIRLAVTAGEIARHYLGAVATWSYAVPCIATDPELLEAWRSASDGARRDIMVTMAQLAAQAGVELDAEVCPDAYVLLNFARGELGLSPGQRWTSPTAPNPLASPMPWGSPVGPTSIFAAGYVRKSAKTEEEVLSTLATLAASGEDHRSRVT